MVGVRISPAARARLVEMAAERRVTQSEVIEALILDAAPGDYFWRQAALQSFIAASLSTLIASKVLSSEEAVAWRDRASKLAREVFGEAPRRRFDVPANVDQDDPRIRALFDAFGVD